MSRTPTDRATLMAQVTSLVMLASPIELAEIYAKVLALHRAQASLGGRRQPPGLQLTARPAWVQRESKQ